MNNEIPLGDEICHEALVRVMLRLSTQHPEWSPKRVRDRAIIEIWKGVTE